MYQATVNRLPTASNSPTATQWRFVLVDEPEPLEDGEYFSISWKKKEVRLVRAPNEYTTYHHAFLLGYMAAQGHGKDLE